MIKYALFFLLLVTLITQSSLTFAFPSCEAEIIKASKKYDIPINILYSVAAQESKRGQFLNPLALNIKGSSVLPNSLQEANKIVTRNLQSGNQLIDIGCMQINYYYHHRDFVTVSSFFNPHDNVDYAARFLKSLYEKYNNWTEAVARYNAGPDNSRAQKNYVCAVISMMSREKLGHRTDHVKEFCDR